MIKSIKNYITKQTKARRVLIALAVSAVLIILLLRWINILDMLSLLRNLNPCYFLLLLLLITGDRIFMAYKWHLLLKVKKMDVSLFQAVRVYYIATFAGFFLPTTVGGDVVRVLKLRQEKQKGSDVLSSVLLERVLGFIASAILALIAALFLVFFLKLKAGKFLVIAGILLFLFSILLLISFSPGVVQRIEKSKKLSGNFLFNKAKKFYLSYWQYRHHRGVLILFLVLSVLEQLVAVTGNYLAALALNLSIPFLYFLLVIPLVQLISRIPIAFNGLGVNEGLLLYFFGLLGFSKTGAFTIGLTGHLAIIIATLPALLFILGQAIKTRNLESNPGLSR